MKKLEAVWWFMATVLALLFIGMGVGLFYPKYMDVPLWFYLTLMAGLAFCIFSIFKWGKSTK